MSSREKHASFLHKTTQKKSFMAKALKKQLTNPSVLSHKLLKTLTQTRPRLALDLRPDFVEKAKKAKKAKRPKRPARANKDC